MAESIDLQCILEKAAENQAFLITDVHTSKDGVTYFKLDNYQFQVIGDDVFHESSKIYDTPFIKARARASHIPEKIVEEKEFLDSAQKRANQFFEIKEAFYHEIVTQADYILANQGVEEMARYIDKMCSVMPMDEGDELVQKLIEKRRNGR